MPSKCLRQEWVCVSPAVVLFKNGQPADHFIGALSEGEIRTILDKHIE